MTYDLHTHTTCSDGQLSPQELVSRALEFGVEVLAITDHDTVAAIESAQHAAQQTLLEVVAGVELSCAWEGFEIHVVGLHIELDNQSLQTLLSSQQRAREERFEQMLVKLEKANRPLSSELLHVEGMPTRKHVADAMVAAGYVSDVQKAFDGYLGKGQRAYVPPQWCSIEQAINAIHAAGGQAVLAHPHAYGLSNKWLNRLLSDAKSVGLDGLEVALGQQTIGHREALAEFAERHQLLASVGSDFHRPQRWRELGQNLCLPERCVPIWSSWSRERRV